MTLPICQFLWPNSLNFSSAGIAVPLTATFAPGSAAKAGLVVEPSAQARCAPNGAM
jgi:hypothetical protein